MSAQTPTVTKLSSPLLSRLLHAMVERGGSDLHLIAGNPPRVRVHGDLLVLEATPLNAEELSTNLQAIAPAVAAAAFDRDDQADFAYAIEGLARFRVNVFRHLGGMGAVMRAIPSEAASIDSLKLPDVVRSLCQHRQGMILVTGKTGSGKSTTLAAMIDEINRTRKGHIITIEDPIEFLHQRHGCLISQREVGTHTNSFSEALLSALREDPDVVLVGELRDLETMSTAITAAEMGILVMGTLAHQRRGRDGGQDRARLPAREAAARAHDAVHFLARRHLAAAVPAQDGRRPGRGARDSRQHLRRFPTCCARASSTSSRRRCSPAPASGCGPWTPPCRNCSTGASSRRARPTSARPRRTASASSPNSRAERAAARGPDARIWHNFWLIVPADGFPRPQRPGPSAELQPR
jgi:predicted ABC-type transport system involved in lysophospholipase L1 biosynthesis ATPase subunit